MISPPALACIIQLNGYRPEREGTTLAAAEVGTLPADRLAWNPVPITIAYMPLISLSAHSLAALPLALSGLLLTDGSLAADEVPIASAYGTLYSCVLWQNHAERTNGTDYNFVFLSPTSLTGVEWECRFGKVTATGPSSWDVQVACTGEEQDGATPPVTTMKIEEADDQSSVAVTDPVALPGGKLIIPSCKLPYEEQLKSEVDRIGKELGR